MTLWSPRNSSCAGEGGACSLPPHGVPWCLPSTPQRQRLPRGLTLSAPAPTPHRRAGGRPRPACGGLHDLGGMRVSWEPWCWSRLLTEDPRLGGLRAPGVPLGASRLLSSSVAASSTSCASIWQASARAWPVAMTKLASAAKVSRPPRSRAFREDRRLVGSSQGAAPGACSLPAPGAPRPRVRPSPASPPGSAGQWLEPGTGKGSRGSYCCGGLPEAETLAWGSPSPRA